MDDGGPIERRTGWDRRQPGERRRNSDRRCQPDRRGNPGADSAVDDGPRSYGFRSFADRRAHAERRASAAAEGDRRNSDDRRAGAVGHGDTDVELTPEEVLALLHDPRDDKE
jgi:hypothetical protein